MYENLHKNVNHIFMQIFRVFWRAIKAINILQLYTAYFLYGF